MVDILGVGRASTHVMSCDASVVVTTPAPGRDVDALLGHALTRLHELEQRWSRFLPSSEISALNAAGGAVSRVSSDTVRLVESLVWGWQLTRGAFDPTLLVTLVELGYAASRDDATLRTSMPSDCRRSGSPDGILVDRGARCIQFPVGTTLDPGGLGKGLAADIVTEELLAAGAAGALVEVGGDLRVQGRPPSGNAWRIAVRPAIDNDSPRFVELASGGVATSSSRLRTWTCDGRTRHHVIDPRTHAPADGDVVACTVIAGTAAWAEAFTKVGFNCAHDDAMDLFAQHSLAASITTENASHHDTTTWGVFCR